MLLDVCCRVWSVECVAGCVCVCVECVRLSVWACWHMWVQMCGLWRPRCPHWCRVSSWITHHFIHQELPCLCLLRLGLSVATGPAQLLYVGEDLNSRPFTSTSELHPPSCFLSDQNGACVLKSRTAVWGCLCTRGLGYLELNPGFNPQHGSRVGTPKPNVASYMSVILAPRSGGWRTWSSKSSLTTQWVLAQPGIQEALALNT